MNPTVSVIIVTWNGKELLQQFLPSVMKTTYQSFEVIVADNASTDGTQEWLHSEYPNCKVIRFSRNHGYCGGNNRAASYATGDLLVFLNNDAEVKPDWLDHLVRPFDNPEIAAAQPKIRSYREPDMFEHAGAAGGYLDIMGYPFCRGRVFDTVEKDQGQYDSEARLFWATGAAMAICKERFIDYGGFDEQFEFHMEEIDLCWRLLNRGHRIGYAPNSVVWHLGGGSLDVADPRKTYYNFRNSLIMLWKNASTSWLKQYFFLRMLLDGLAAIHATLQGQFRDIPAIFKAHIHFYFRWRGIHLQRSELQSKRLQDEDPEEMVRTSIIDDYFLRGNRTYSEIIARLNRK